MNLSIQNVMLAVVVGLGLAAGVVGYKLVRDMRIIEESLKRFTALQPVPKTVLAQPEDAIEAAVDAVPDVAAAKKQLWSTMQAQYANAVPQVFAQMTEFNWLEPYKTPNQMEGMGSGFFINKEGEMITNAHVVEQAIWVGIQIPRVGKRRFEVDVIGISPERDLALLRLKKNELEALKKALNVKELPYLKMGDSDSIHRADKLMALGYPLGQQGLKSTTGVVSGREHLGGQYLIQISAPINKGNSGGPSLDSKGRVIGVNSSGVPGAQNVGYIIPSNEVLLFLDQLSTVPAGKGPKLLKKPYLGVYFLNNATEDLTTFLGNPAPGGLYVVSVQKGSPFEKAGFKAGDMLYKLDGYAIDTAGEMSVPWCKEDRISIVDYVSRLRLGHVMNYEFYRKGELKHTQLKLAQTETPIRQMFPGYEKIDYEVLAGFVFMPLSLNHIVLLAQFAPDIMQYAVNKKKQTEPAVLITHVMLNSPASRARSVGAGGVIQEVNGQRVKTLSDFRIAVMQGIKSGYLTIKTNDEQFAAIPLHDIMQDEPRLASTYFYPLSETYKELQNRMGSRIKQEASEASAPQAATAA